MSDESPRPDTVDSDTDDPSASQGPTLFDPLPTPGVDEVPRITLENLEIRDVDDFPRETPQQVLFEEPEETEPEVAVETQQKVEPASEDHRNQGSPDPTQVPILARLTSGLLDLAAMLAVALFALVGSDLLGVSPRIQLLPAVLLFVLTFSFLYHVISLLFWGRTPGMASVGLVARDLTGLPLTAQQAASRWLGSLGTLLLGGIPMVVSWVTGKSLADLVSESVTLAQVPHD